MLWATVGGSRSPSNLSCRCGELLPDWWRVPAVTGERTQFCVYSPGESRRIVYMR